MQPCSLRAVSRRLVGSTLDAATQRFYSCTMSPVAKDVDVDSLTAAALSQLTNTTVLNCLGKQPGPPSLAADLVHILDLSVAVRDDLWTVLEPNLGAINTPRTTEAVASFCERHGVDPGAIAPVIGACRFLFRSGAQHNTSPALLADDLRQLLAVDETDEQVVDGVLACVIPLYERAGARMRLKSMHEALTDHGRVVTDVKWRVDDIRCGNSGEAIDVPVTLLTLRYREGDTSGQTTVQLLPDQLEKLRDACNQALR